MINDEARSQLPHDPIPAHNRLGHDGGTPIIVGHYWASGTPALLSDKVVCVDYSIGKGGKLVAYRWDAEPLLEQRKFHWIGGRAQ